MFITFAPFASCIGQMFSLHGETSKISIEVNDMKKLMSVLLCMAVLLAFAGCSAQTTTTTPTAEPSLESTAEPTAEPAEEPTDEPAEEPVKDPEADAEVDAPLYTIEYDATLFAVTASDSTDTYAPTNGSADAALTVQYLAAEEVEAYTAEHLGDGAKQIQIGAGAYEAAMRETEREGTKTTVYLVNLPDGGALALTCVSANGEYAEELAAMLASFTLN